MLQGILMLTPQNTIVLGGQVEYLENARVRAHNELKNPAVGKTIKSKYQGTLEQQASTAAWDSTYTENQNRNLFKQIPTQDDQHGTQIDDLQIRTQKAAQHEAQRQLEACDISEFFDDVSPDTQILQQNQNFQQNRQDKMDVTNQNINKVTSNVQQGQQSVFNSVVNSHQPSTLNTPQKDEKLFNYPNHQQYEKQTNLQFQNQQKKQVKQSNQVQKQQRKEWPINEQELHFQNYQTEQNKDQWLQKQQNQSNQSSKIQLKNQNQNAQVHDSLYRQAQDDFPNESKDSDNEAWEQVEVSLQENKQSYHQNNQSNAQQTKLQNIIHQDKDQDRGSILQSSNWKDNQLITNQKKSNSKFNQSESEDYLNTTMAGNTIEQNQKASINLVPPSKSNKDQFNKSKRQEQKVYENSDSLDQDFEIQFESEIEQTKQNRLQINKRNINMQQLTNRQQGFISNSINLNKHTTISEDNDNNQQYNELKFQTPQRQQNSQISQNNLPDDKYNQKYHSKIHQGKSQPLCSQNIQRQRLQNQAVQINGKQGITQCDQQTDTIIDNIKPLKTPQSQEQLNLARQQKSAPKNKQQKQDYNYNQFGASSGIFNNSDIIQIGSQENNVLDPQQSNYQFQDNEMGELQHKLDSLKNTPLKNISPVISQQSQQDKNGAIQIQETIREGKNCKNKVMSQETQLQQVNDGGLTKGKIKANPIQNVQRHKNLNNEVQEIIDSDNEQKVLITSQPDKNEADYSVYTSREQQINKHNNKCKQNPINQQSNSMIQNEEHTQYQINAEPQADLQQENKFTDQQSSWLENKGFNQEQSVVNTTNGQQQKFYKDKKRYLESISKQPTKITKINEHTLSQVKSEPQVTSNDEMLEVDKSVTQLHNIKQFNASQNQNNITQNDIFQSQKDLYSQGDLLQDQLNTDSINKSGIDQNAVSDQTNFIKCKEQISDKKDANTYPTQIQELYCHKRGYEYLGIQIAHFAKTTQYIHSQDQENQAVFSSNSFKIMGTFQCIVNLQYKDQDNKPLDTYKLLVKIEDGSALCDAYLDNTLVVELFGVFPKGLCHKSQQETEQLRQKIGKFMQSFYGIMVLKLCLEDKKVKAHIFKLQDQVAG